MSLVLGLFFVLSWLVQTVAGWVDFAAEAATHGETPVVFGDSGYLWPWLQGGAFLLNLLLLGLDRGRQRRLIGGWSAATG